MINYVMILWAAIFAVIHIFIIILGIYFVMSIQIDVSQQNIMQKLNLKAIDIAKTENNI